VTTSERNASETDPSDPSETNPSEVPIQRHSSVGSTSKVTRTSSGLRDALFDQLDKLRQGQISPLAANAFARISDQIIHSVELEMNIERNAAALQKRGETLHDILPPDIPLGDRETAKMVELNPRWRSK
jgi:hypothetical protein